MTTKDGRKCHVCLDRRTHMSQCDYCGHNTCHREYCITAVLGKKMCLKCQMDPAHRTLREVPVG